MAAQSSLQQVFLLLLVWCLSSSSALKMVQPVVFAEWTVLNFTWDGTHTYSDYISSQMFIPENNAMAGINVDRYGNIYVTVPRWRPGVPGTLNKLDLAADGESYTLTPYPSWDMQEEGVDGDLQNCQSMTIDSQGRMWVIEVGRRNFLDSDPVNGPAGVWIIDMSTDEIINKYYFPNSVASYDNSFVNDIVLDESRDLAYLTDANGNGGLIVYNHGAGTSRRYSSVSTMNQPDYVMIIDGTNYGNTIFTTPSDGIAITDDCEALFYGAVQGTALYRVPTSVLRDFTTTTAEIDAQVQFIGHKNPSDGFKYRQGVLYYGDLPNSNYHAVVIGATDMPNITATAKSVRQDPTQLRWVDTFALDMSNPYKIWMVSNRLDLFITNTMDFTGGQGANFRVNYADVGLFAGAAGRNGLSCTTLVTTVGVVIAAALLLMC